MFAKRLCVRAERDTMSENDLKRLTEYAQTDTLLYFAPYPEKLTALQERKWGAVIDAFNADGADLKPTKTLTVAAISPKTERLIKKKRNALGDAALPWFFELAGAYRSVLLAFAVCEGKLSEDEAFALSNLEESYQNELWQTDAEALKARGIRHDAAKNALRHIKG